MSAARTGLVGLIGAGRMASALARGWGRDVLCTDHGSGRAATLVAEVGGEALPENADVADRAELVVLCHKPAQLETVAKEIDGRASAVVSILSGVPTSRLRQAYTRTPVVRLAVNLPVEVREGVICYCIGQAADEALQTGIINRFAELGTVVQVPEDLMSAVISVSGVGPAFLSLFIEAHVDSGIRAGLPPDLAARLAVQTMAGTAELLARWNYDTLALRRAVASPGGTTAEGLAALESAGLRAAVLSAGDAVRDSIRLREKGNRTSS
jgi:pyrroline-5-carboxylate reductase